MEDNTILNNAECMVCCPQCGEKNEADGRFCVYCGAELNAPQAAANNAPAFAPVAEEPAFAPAAEEPAFAPAEEEPAFAPAAKEPAFAPAAEEPAFAPVAEEPAFAATEEPAFAPAKAPVVSRYEEPNNIFAQGMPEWSLEPPQIMVRRR